jgi:hypothetical protein
LRKFNVNQLQQTPVSLKVRNCHSKKSQEPRETFFMSKTLLSCKRSSRSLTVSQSHNLVSHNLSISFLAVSQSHNLVSRFSLLASRFSTCPNLSSPTKAQNPDSQISNFILGLKPWIIVNFYSPFLPCFLSMHH